MRNTQKSWMVYAFLGFVFGGWAIHNFYAGNTKKAIIQLLLTLSLVASPFSMVWAYYDAYRAITTKLIPYPVNTEVEV